MTNEIIKKLRKEFDKQFPIGKLKLHTPKLIWREEAKKFFLSFLEAQTWNEKIKKMKFLPRIREKIRNLYKI